jgi:hypothetical protein
MTTVITTFSRDGYELYGHTMIESWLKFWPSNYSLVVYTEGYRLVEQDSRLSEIDINVVCPNLERFKQSSRNLKNQKQSRIDKTIKWCHKVYAIEHALTINDNYLIFLDGDTRTIQPYSPGIEYQLVSNNLFAVHFENLKDGLHFETGFMVFNLRHEKIQWLKNTLTTAYNSLEIYNMKKTWDGYWFAHLYKTYNLPVKNLAENCAGVFCNPLIKNILKHDVGTAKYSRAGYNKFTGKNNE